MSENSIIAIDGYSSSGKSSFAKRIAAQLNFVYIDSGAMYRAVALYCLQHHILSDGALDKDRLIQELPDIQIGFSLDPETGKQVTLLNGKDVEDLIRGVEVSNVVSRISQIKEVRKQMVTMQRELAGTRGVVMDGRDIGTVVFPHAKLKIFLDAGAEVRAERRYKELKKKGLNVVYEDILANIRMRDHEDETRTESPLRKAPDAMLLDNSKMNMEAQMEWFRKNWKKVTSE